MGITGNDQTQTEVQAALCPIVGLTKSLPTEVLEAIVVEAIYKHRYLRDIAELRHSESSGVKVGGTNDEHARIAYVRAMIDVHAQQTVLSTLLDVLGYIPQMLAD